MLTAPRIAVVGFDGMDAALVQRWACAGHLPTFARLLETSSWTQFELPPDYSSGMVWPSINTGLASTDHQAYFGTRLVEGTYTSRPRHHSDLRGHADRRMRSARVGGRRESHPSHLLAQVEYGVFHEAHGAGHYLWHLADTANARFDAVRMNLQGRGAYASGRTLRGVVSGDERTGEHVMHSLCCCVTQAP